MISRAAITLLLLGVAPAAAQDPVRRATDEALREALADEAAPQQTVEVVFGDVAGGVSEVEFGAEFPVTVLRSWPGGLEPTPWDDGALAPLVAEPRGLERQELGGRIVEVRRFVARAFRRGAVTVQVGGPRTLFVASALRDDDDDLELPGEPMRAPAPWWPLVDRAALFGVGIAALSWLALRAFRRGGDRRGSTATPDRAVLSQLDALRGRTPTTSDEHRADAVETAAAVRTYLAQRFDVEAPELTTDEFSATPELGPGDRARVGAFLSACDRVKFARHRPAPEERTALLDAIRTFVEDTRRREVETR